MKKTLIVANWKMNLSTHEASILVKRLEDTIKIHRSVEAVLAPNMMVLQAISQEIDKRKFSLAAQNAYFQDEGAYTGEVSFTMLRGLADYCLVGHSERRIYFNESLEEVRDKVTAAVRNSITPILCVGETHESKVAGETNRVIHDQVVTALANLTSEEVENIVIAYEPVWAISTFGAEIPKPTDIQSAVSQIRYQVRSLYGDKAADSIRVLYGGSVDSHDAYGYLSIEGVDGALVGHASLNYLKFANIIESAYQLNINKK